MDWIRSSWRWLLALAVVWTAVIVAPFVFLTPTTHVIQCDGSVPTWMITEENRDTGCVEILDGPAPADWDGSWICTGLCEVPNPSPYFPDSQP